MSSLKCSALPKKTLNFVVLVTVIVWNVSAFNLSPRPHKVLEEPNHFRIENAPSSYFGFSVNLRKNRLVQLIAIYIFFVLPNFSSSRVPKYINDVEFLVLTTLANVRVCLYLKLYRI